MSTRLPAFVFAALTVWCGAALAESNEAARPEASPHSIAAAKLIVGDLPATQAFFESMFGMKEVAHYSAEGLYDEPIMGFENGARLALFHPKTENPLEKSRFPVALIYTPEFDAVVKRIEEAKHPVTRLPASQSGPFRIAIARDPSGNAIEILARDGQPAAVGGSKLIVSDRAKAEEFYSKVFGVKPLQRYQTAGYDEVLMSYGEGAWLALFQPKAEAPLPKSHYAVVAIYSHEFDDVLARIKDIGLGYRDVKSGTPGERIIVAQDPSGNAVEIISR